MFSKYIKSPNSIFLSKRKKGFSFLEVMISVFIFSLMMVTISMTFASLFKSYKNTKAIQTNLENAQFAMNTMAKSLRTSSIIIPAVPTPNATSIKFFNYSDNNCISYTFNNSTHSLRVASAPIDPIAYPTSADKKTRCGSISLPTPSSIMPDTVGKVVFSVIPSYKGTDPINDPSKMGKVTISIKVCSSIACTSSATIQSSVSLRDYNAVGL